MQTPFNHRKYKPFQPVRLLDRNWPNRVIERAPRWCSVDLRDGNQALIEPMNPKQKRQLYQQLLAVGFKEIEIGFPAASGTDYAFVRELIEENAIPDDVTVQVLTQAREELIAKSFEALKGAKRAIVHLYNSTSTVQRDQVFQMDRAGIIGIAEHGARLVKEYAARYPETEWTFQYSPESYTGTELDFSVEIVNAVTRIWQPTADKPVIINLPATVEMSTPNVYADQIEWFCRHVEKREALLVSLHTHNDRGCAVAAAELGVMAGADRVEGTLLGNGERTGNMDIITMAMNLYCQGVDPELDFSNMDEIVRSYKACTGMPVHPRHPYAGELVFTAFSGSHQDAIKKCLARRRDEEPWEVAYLPIDPADLGRSYQEVIRINSQSGKGGIAYVLERDYGLQLPRWLQIDFAGVIQAQAELTEGEVNPQVIWQLFQQHYLQGDGRYQLQDYQIKRQGGEDRVAAHLDCDGSAIEISGSGAGAVEAFVNGLNSHSGQRIIVVDYSEHALSESAQAQAMAYVQLNIDGQRHCGVAQSGDIIEASMSAIVSALNHAIAQQRSAA